MSSIGALVGDELAGVGYAGCAIFGAGLLPLMFMLAAFTFECAATSATSIRSSSSVGSSFTVDCSRLAAAFTAGEDGRGGSLIGTSSLSCGAKYTSSSSGAGKLGAESTAETSFCVVVRLRGAGLSSIGGESTLVLRRSLLLTDLPWDGALLGIFVSTSPNRLAIKASSSAVRAGLGFGAAVAVFLLKYLLMPLFNFSCRSASSSRFRLAESRLVANSSSRLLYMQAIHTCFAVSW